MRYTPAQQLARKIAKLKKQGIDENDVVLIELHHQLETLRNNYLTTSKQTHTYPVKYLNNNNTDAKFQDITEIFKLIKSKDTKYGYSINVGFRSTYRRNTYTPCGIFYGTNSIRKLSGIMLFQIKGKPLTSAILKEVNSNNYTFATYYEFEDKVTNIFVKAENISPNNIKSYQKLIRSHYEAKLKKLMISFPSIYVKLPLTYDPNLYYDINSLPIKTINDE
jgi:hypothetical protein